MQTRLKAEWCRLFRRKAPRRKTWQRGHSWCIIGSTTDAVLYVCTRLDPDTIGNNMHMVVRTAFFPSRWSPPGMGWHTQPQSARSTASTEGTHRHSLPERRMSNTYPGSPNRIVLWLRVRRGVDGCTRALVSAKAARHSARQDQFSCSWAYKRAIRGEYQPVPLRGQNDEHESV